LYPEVLWSFKYKEIVGLRLIFLRTNYSHEDVYYLQIILHLEQICVRNFLTRFHFYFSIILLPEISFVEGQK